MSNNPMLGTLLIVSGPSGSGKTTLCRRAESAGLTSYSISCTTRAPRPGEQHGVDYYFLTPEEFAAKVAAGEFLEHASVHGNSYGTLRSEVVRLLEAGQNVVMDIDVQGAASIRTCPHPTIRRAYADVYIHVPPAELEARLRGRQTDSEDTILLRLRNAAMEDARRSEYQYLLTSADREHDYARFSALLTALSLRSSLSASADALQG
ncbi:MAG: guanylate kinase [Akkermansiaceae bacterium]|nr:guanylate kinase [Akkermansiaceae bacterium]